MLEKNVFETWLVFGDAFWVLNSVLVCTCDLATNGSEEIAHILVILQFVQLSA